MVVVVVLVVVVVVVVVISGLWPLQEKGRHSYLDVSVLHTSDKPLIHQRIPCRWSLLLVCFGSVVVVVVS